LERCDEFIGAAASQGVAFSAANLILPVSIADSNDPRTDRFDGFRRSQGSDPAPEK
jgi:hypothetical protein